MLLVYLGWACNLGFFICCILVAVQAFKHQQVLLGILSILCGLVALVLAWTKQAEWGISKNLAIAMTVLLVAAIALTGAGMANASSTMVVP